MKVLTCALFIFLFCQTIGTQFPVNFRIQMLVVSMLLMDECYMMEQHPLESVVFW